MITDIIFNFLKRQYGNIRALHRGFEFYFVNHIVSHIPGYEFRHWFYKHIWGIQLGKGSSIHLGTFLTGKNIEIGEYTAIGRRSYLDGRGGLKIGNCVSVSPDVQFLTASHDMNDPDFGNVFASIVVEDYVWIGTRSMIMPGVKLCYGCVVAAGAVVTKDVHSFAVVAGVPAKPISKQRKQGMRYKATWFLPFD
jgi:maltose O-acetyltransferase